MQSLPLRNALHSLWLRILLAILAVAALLVLGVMFFPWDVLREPLNRYVSEHTGRHFAITRRLDVKLGATTRILADGLEFANPAWAKDPYLVRAQGAEVQLRLWPLLHRRIEMPLVAFHKPELGLQMEADGRKSWALGRDSGDPANVPEIGELAIDDGSLHFVAPHYGADIHATFGLQGAAPAAVREDPSKPLPLTFKAHGAWKRLDFNAEGRAGNVLRLAHHLQRPFPAELRATAGRTTLVARGEVVSIATMDGANAQVRLQGANLADLYHAMGVVMPETPPYTANFHLTRQGDTWDVRGISAKIGNSDLSGNLKYDSGTKVGLLTGDVHSKVLDFNDLAPMVGLPPLPPEAAKTHVAGSAPVAKAPKAAKPPRDPNRKVLPTTKLDTQRLRAMDADVRYDAAVITHPRHLPFERAKLHVAMKGGVLKLDPLDLGIAGGRVAGRLSIDARTDVAAVDTRLDVRGIQVQRLFPTLKLAQASLGQFHGDIALRGRGNSVAQMLATSSGDVGLAMGSGQVSNLLLEFAGLDFGEVIKFLLKGDQTVQVRCVGAAFDVNQGRATSRVMVVDTTDTVIYGEGGFSFANETIDLMLRPYPKDASILAFRTPLKLTGTFAAPKPGVEMGPIVGRAGAALALGAINPLLALAATIETGPGKDANCGAVLREATGPAAEARLAKASQLPASAASSTAMGGPPRKRWFSGWGDPRGRPGAHYPLDPPPQR
ncbi:AsmA family protein [Ramlibacter albus]|uniref:AsmA family protein n=1 Tax=Ramlibacter albus TaxID=2079448 RepID=A0A923M702_9BURK|nr:AsmA family protein [Ramlibacter albus]MBC5765402.1 AsmA family protein [Ramlibacter albus]